jgi:uncharacterized protein (TIGR02421 family)
MLRLTIDEIIDSIRKGQHFSAITENNAFSITIEKYVPFFCAAIHNGGNFIKELLPKLSLSKSDRWLEEDPYTGIFIDSLPIRIITYDSRYLYDLNRDQSHCLYETAWGKKVWKKPLTRGQKEMLLQRHDDFYRVIDALMSYLKMKFGSVLVFDIHSYNHQRLESQKDLPLFNLGTEGVKKKKYEPYIKNFMEELSSIGSGKIKNHTARNAVFFGKGYFLGYLMKKYTSTLVLATEVKKVYVDETTGDEFPEYIEIIREGLKRSILNSAAYFSTRETELTVRQKYRLLGSSAQDTLMKVDKKIYSLIKNFEVLHYVNPVNIETSRKRFLSSKENPSFRYKPVTLKTHDLRKGLYSLPLDSIGDITLVQLYRDIIEHYIRLADLITSRGTDNFLYNSLLVYGEPKEIDITNAEFLLYCRDIPTEPSPILHQDEIIARFQEAVAPLEIPFKVEVEKSMTARVMVLNSKKSLKIRKGLTLTEREMDALVVHEVGVHVTTTINGSLQPLSFFSYGVPGYTKTQEGLALLSEYCTGSMTLQRLKILALRTLSVAMMIKGEPFHRVFEMIRDQNIIDDNESFYLASRVFRGGGYTKDYLYLSGFISLYNYHGAGRNTTPLAAGKISLDYIEVVKELLARKIALKPALPLPLPKKRNHTNAELAYVVNSLKTE